MDNRKWVDEPDLQDYMYETNYMRTFLFKQHGFFAETCAIKESLLVFSNHESESKFFADKWHKYDVKAVESSVNRDAPKPKPNK